MAASSTSDSESIPPTAGRWALALAGDAAALRELAESYWYCIYAWWRRTGHDAESAVAATLADWTRWLTTDPPQPQDRGATRMREWLLARLVSNMVRDGPPAYSIDAAWAEQRFAQEPAGEPDAIFQRRWALTVLELTIAAQRSEYAARDQSALFDELLPFSGFENAGEARYAETALRVGLSTGAVRKAVFDFRTRQREILRGFVGDTVADPADIESEITALLCAADSPGPAPTALHELRPEEMLARAMQSAKISGAGGRGWTPPTPEEMAHLFPHYEILSMLGRGGMGAVYQVRQIELDRLVALKLLPLEISVNKDFADRFRREARAMAKLNHPNIITVHDFGQTAEGHLFFAMEFVEGANLHDIIHGPGLDAENALSIAGKVCIALAYAHGKGVVHRDMKPANVMIDTASQVKVADFGLARLIDASTEDLGHTVTGTVMGTPDYMAPEQKKGMRVDHRADIYSLGVMIYEMLCRETPQGAFDPPSQRTGCDARIDQIVFKAMQQSPERRYQSTQEMRADVETARTPLPAPVVNSVSAPPRDVKRATTHPPRSKAAGIWIASAVALVTVLYTVVFLPKRGAQDTASGQSVAAMNIAGNLVSNPSFETPSEDGFPLGWEQGFWDGGATWKSADGRAAHSGQRCVHVVAADGGANTAILSTVKVKPRTNYRVAAWVKTKGVVGALGALVCKHITASNRGEDFVFTAPFRSRAVRGDSDWTLIERIFNSGDESEIVVSCTFGGWGRSVGEAWFDDVSFTEVSNAAADVANQLEGTYEAATKDVPFVNTLGMKFVPVPITGGPSGGQLVLFCIWETRVEDYRVFAEATKTEIVKPDYAQTGDHPAVNVSWDDAKAFCEWLSKKEGREYRLPTDHEWSCAVGIGNREDPEAPPNDKEGKIANLWPWGTTWPPPHGTGNFADATAKTKHTNMTVIDGYDDGFADTAPVGTFASNQFGIFDLAGNLWEWCGDVPKPGDAWRSQRGAAFNSPPAHLLSSCRVGNSRTSRNFVSGFRCVLAPASAAK